ncbi:unnamed protein product [Symbiodinium natans]|uniref:Leucine-rich repeat-containing N-terminal plant-type domain-containing protein n=1 Tax=Symbiodinium natans TaxID=878477 RepID=A0A812U744_9DINO|nr:unnamed protein product [Symbiodinium natans]
MANLWELVLSGNQFFSSLPSTFPTLTQLRVLDISETGVRGSAPKRMEQMSQLVVFDIHGTRVERGKFRHTYPDTTVTSMGGDGKNCAPMLEDPCCLFGRSSNRCTLEEILRRLWTPPYWQRHAYPADTPFCSWSGVTCATVEGRPRVVRLILEDALMSGMLNGHWEDLGELRELRVRSRRTTGGLQWKMGSMSKLEILELQGPFDGVLWGNSWIGKLTSLRVLILRTVFRDAKRANKDRLPATIANLRNLEVLDLTGNRVRMQFQSLVGSLPKLNLRELRLSGNLLEGSIGKEVSDLPNLEVLALDGNMLESKLPGELAQLSRLQELDLRNNRFEGKVPRGLRQLKLTRLALGNNQFTKPIQSKNCAPVEEDPCELFRLQDLDRGDVNVWPFILVASLLLSGLFYKDRTCQGFSVRPGALELAAWSSDGEEWEGRRKFRNCWAVLEVCELCFVIAMPLAPLPLSFPLLSQIALLTLVLFKLALFRLHRKELVFRPLDVLLPEGSSVLMLPSQEMAGHAKLLGIIVCGYLATFTVVSKMLNVFMVMEPFCCLVLLLAVIRTTFASRTVPFEEQREDKANELLKVALVVEVFTSDQRWHRINERTVHVDFQLPSSSQRSFVEVELQSSTSSCTPPAETTRRRLPPSRRKTLRGRCTGTPAVARSLCL